MTNSLYMTVGNNYNTTLIIGNGFDRNLGMNTSYEEFYKWLEQDNFFSQYEKNPVIAFISSKRAEENWCYFEDLILEYAKYGNEAYLLRKIEQLRDVVDNIQKGKNTTTKKLREFQDLTTTCPTVQQLIDYLTTHRTIELSNLDEARALCKIVLKDIDAYSKNISHECQTAVSLLSEKMNEFLCMAEPAKEMSAALKLIATLWGLDTTNIDTIAWDATTRVDASIFYPGDILTVSFNYTDTTRVIYDLLKAMSTKYIDDIGEEMVTELSNHIYQIHGKLGGTMAFGACDDKDIPKELMCLKKHTVLEVNTKKKFAKILKQSNRIVIVGHALHGIDFEYYRDFFKNKKSETEVYVLYHNEDARKEIEEGLRKQGVEPYVKYRKISLEDEGFNELLEVIGKEQRDGIRDYYRPICRLS